MKIYKSIEEAAHKNWTFSRLPGEDVITLSVQCSEGEDSIIITEEELESLYEFLYRLNRDNV